MAGDSTGGETGWAKWLREQLREREWQSIEVTRRSGGRVGSSQMTRWLDSSRIPDLESIRKVCAVLGVPAVAGMIAAGRLKPDDVGATVVLRDDLTELTNAELLARGQAILEALAARIPDDVPRDVDPLVSVDQLAPFRRRNAQVVTPEGEEGHDWAALDRQK